VRAGRHVAASDGMAQMLLEALVRHPASVGAGRTGIRPSDVRTMSGHGFRFLQDAPDRDPRQR
jgi:hypothetical protein